MADPDWRPPAKRRPEPRRHVPGASRRRPFHRWRSKLPKAKHKTCIADSASQRSPNSYILAANICCLFASSSFLASRKALQREQSVQGLNADQIAVVVHVPDRCRLGGSVDDGAPVVGIRLGHLINSPMVRLGGIAKHLPAV